ncbi:hypothetical protein BH20ACT2_BH20ACT2_22650 [soil metagenome]
MRRRRGDDGAALVELAFAIPVLIALVMGIIEFGWWFTQDLDVRHAAREAARLVAVDYRPDPAGDQVADLVAEVCDRIDDRGGVSITLDLPPASGSADLGEAGQRVTVTVEKPYDSLTGLFTFIAADTVHSSVVTTRLETDASWATVAGPLPPVPCS